MTEPVSPLGKNSSPSAGDATHELAPKGVNGTGELAPVVSLANGSEVEQVTPPPIKPSIVVVPVAGRTAPETSADADADASGILHANWWQQVPSWLTSTVAHLALMLGLALLTSIDIMPELLPEMELAAGGDGSPGSSGDLDRQFMEASAELQQVAPPVSSEHGEAPDVPSVESLDSVLTMLPNVDFQPAMPGLALGAAEVAGGGGGAIGNILGGNGDGLGHGLDMRMNGPTRAALIKSEGGTERSEQAVANALKWLAEHQNYDGSWSFQHQKSPKCHGSCDHAGSSPAKNAATAIALLPFLGSGQTHLEGAYKRNIDLGLKYLIRSMDVAGDLGSFWETGGTMYSHGLAAIALCEAYGMTHDRTLQDPAQMVVNYMVEAQDPRGGGWRYFANQPGDTSVVGWQLMALRSAQLAYLRVPPTTFRKTGYFLDSVQTDRGAAYGYQSGENRKTTTAIGLLSRMYLGWKHDTPALARGVQTLATVGPSTDKSAMKNNMYYNYYATQVMHHYGGSQWKRWNEELREYLISTQSRQGHEYGSWYFEGEDFGKSQGGRLYFTALAAMTLEVYYRYMPLYREDSTNINANNGNR